MNARDETNRPAEPERPAATTDEDVTNVPVQADADATSTTPKPEPTGAAEKTGRPRKGVSKPRQTVKASDLARTYSKSGRGKREKLPLEGGPHHGTDVWAVTAHGLRVLDITDRENNGVSYRVCRYVRDSRGTLQFSLTTVGKLEG